MNIFKEMGLSIYSYKSYTEFLKNKKIKVFGFAIMLMLIYFIVTMGIPLANFLIETGGIVGDLEEYLPDFELRDGELWVDDTITYEYRDTYIEIDTDPDYVFYSAYEMRDFLYDYTQVLMMDSEKMIIKNNGEVNELYFSDLNFDFSKEDLMAYIPFVYIFIAVFMLIAYIWMTALFFFGVLFLSLLGMIVASCMNCRLTFGQLYLLGVYSRTLPLIIKAVVSFLPFHIPFFLIINFGISLIIIGCAIQKMKGQQKQEPMEYTSETKYVSSNNPGNNNQGNDFTWMK